MLCPYQHCSADASGLNADAIQAALDAAAAADPTVTGGNITIELNQAGDGYERPAQTVSNGYEYGFLDGVYVFNACRRYLKWFCKKILKILWGIYMAGRGLTGQPAAGAAKAAVADAPEKPDFSGATALTFDDANGNGASADASGLNADASKCCTIRSSEYQCFVRTSIVCANDTIICCIAEFAQTNLELFVNFFGFS